MKATNKFICVLLAAVLTVTGFSGCADSGEGESSIGSSSYSVDVKGLATEGKIPEVTFALGSSVDEAVKHYQDAFAADNQNPEIVITEEDGNTEISVGAYSYFYKTERKAEGISAISVVDTAYGFYSGSVTMMQDVKSAIDAEPAETEPTAEDVFFLPGSPPSGAKMLTYTFGGNVLKMIFYNNYLSAVFLYDSATFS